MAAIAIELNDAGIVVAGEEGFLTAPSPGFALLEGSDLLVGDAARLSARLKPRRVNHRFWDQLTVDALPRPFPRSLGHADLVHAHLSAIWNALERQSADGGKAASVLLAVPGGYSSRQLGLLLGIARACEIPVTGMVDAAVAAVSLGARGKRVLHLDVTLHRVVWTEVESEGELIRGRVEVVDTVGLISLWDSWMRRIADLFVRETRFDPFHQGTSEQLLYDRLPQWLAEIGRRGRTIATLTSGGSERSVELGLENLNSASQAQLEPAIELGRSLAGSGEATSILVTDRVAGIPGLTSKLSSIAEDGLEVLSEGAAARGALLQRQHIDAPGSELTFVSRLPVATGLVAGEGTLAAPVVVPAREPRECLPTHLLYGGVAHLITEVPLRLGLAVAGESRGIELTGSTAGISRNHCSVYRSRGSVVVEDHSTYGTFVNGRQIKGTAEVAIGDRLRLGSPGQELLLIEVRREDG